MTIGTCFLPQAVEAFSIKLATVIIEAIICNTRDHEALILKNAVDFAIVEGTVRSPDIIADSFDEDRLLLLCGRGHPLYGSGSIKASQLNGQKFIVR